MSESTHERQDGNTRSCQFLHCFRQTTPPPKASEGGRLHTHRCWQLELIREAPAVVRLADRQIEIAPETLFMLPPAEAHRFEYPDPSVRWLSVKFSARGWDGPARLWARRDMPVADALGCVLEQMLPASRPAGPGDMTVNATLLAVMHELYPTMTAEPPSLSDRVCETVERSGGRYLTVAGLADRLGYTSGYVSSRFRRERGEALKTYLDRQRAQFAEGLLAYTDRTVSEIADLMGFGDVFAFSRFFHRVRGERPTAYRQKGLAPHPPEE